MVTSEEKRRLIEAYREPPDVRATLASAAAGLLVILVVAAAGASLPEVDPAEAAALSAKRLATGR
jgi:hypothetical protein